MSNMKLRNSFILSLITLFTTSCTIIPSSEFSSPTSSDESSSPSKEDTSSMIPSSSNEEVSSESEPSSEAVSSENEPSSYEPSSETASSESEPSSNTPQIDAEYVTIHYQRNDNNYSSWALWLWEKGYDGQEYQFNGKDNFGAYARYSLNTWSKSIETNGFAPFDNNIFANGILSSSIAIAKGVYPLEFLVSIG